VVWFWLTTMPVIYTIAAVVGAVITPVLAGSVNHQGALPLLAWGILGANMAALTIAMLRLLISGGLDRPDGFGFLHTRRRYER
jgi:hypothetical protein